MTSLVLVHQVTSRVPYQSSLAGKTGHINSSEAVRDQGSPAGNKDQVHNSGVCEGSNYLLRFDADVFFDRWGLANSCAKNELPSYNISNPRRQAPSAVCIYYNITSILFALDLY
jgi:hypothetical protein